MGGFWTYLNPRVPIGTKESTWFSEPSSTQPFEDVWYLPSLGGTAESVCTVPLTVETVGADILIPWKKAEPIHDPILCHHQLNPLIFKASMSKVDSGKFHRVG